MIVALIGLVVCIWAIGSGFGTTSYDRISIFVGPIGFLFNIVVLLIGGGLMAIGFGFIR